MKGDNMSYLYYKAINWDEIEDNVDKYTWEQLTTNFWLDIRVPVTNDQPNWAQLPAAAQQQIGQQLAASSLLAVFQSEVGTPALRHDKRTQQEEAVLNTITFMKSVHAKSCTTIFRALVPGESQTFFDWADADPQLQAEIEQLTAVCQSGTPLQKKALFMLTETALSFGKYATVLQQTTLPNTNQMLHNILQGSAIFCAYLGYKFQLGFNELAPSAQADLTAWITQQFNRLVNLEADYLNATCGDAEAALNLCRYGVNQTLAALGLSASYSVTPTPFVTKLAHIAIDQDQFRQQVTAANHPADLEVMTDDDYDF